MHGRGRRFRRFGHNGNQGPDGPSIFDEILRRDTLHVLDGDPSNPFQELIDFAPSGSDGFGLAKQHGVPPYVIFHDATLREIAMARPASLDELGHISGVGARKLDAYGADILSQVR